MKKRIRRWLCFAALAGFHLANNFAVEHIDQATSLLGSDAFGFVFLGALASQPVLLAIWEALGRGHPAIRVPGAVLALTVLFSVPLYVMPSHGSQLSQSIMTGVRSILWFGGVAALVGAAGLFALLRSKFDWQVESVESPPTAPNARRRGNFALRDLFLLTALAAVAVATGKVALEVSDLDDLEMWTVLGGGGLIAGFVVALFAMPLVPLVLGHAPRRGALYSAIGAMVVTLVLPFAAPGFKTPERMQIMLVPLGFFASVILSLGLVRIAGYRLRRKDDMPLPLPEHSGPQSCAPNA